MRHLVADQKEGLAVFVVLADHGDQHLDEGGVDAVERLIQQDQRRVGHHRANELEQLLLAARDLRGGAGLHAVERRRLQQRFRTARRSEEHTSELQSLMRISYAVFCLKKKT